MSDISERAAQLAKAHPAGEVLENAFLGLFAFLGMIFGAAFRAGNWALFHAYTLVFVIWLAVQDGFKKTSGIKPKEVQAPQQPALQSALLDDPRYADHTTPFGVPYGPNVHASHD